MIQIKKKLKANILSSKDSTGCFSLGDIVSSVRLAGKSWFAVALVMVEVLATFGLSEYSTEERLRLLLTVAVSSAAGSSFINSCWVDSTFSTWRLMLHQQIYLERTSYCKIITTALTGPRLPNVHRPWCQENVWKWYATWLIRWVVGLGILASTNALYSRVPRFKSR